FIEGASGPRGPLGQPGRKRLVENLGPPRSREVGLGGVVVADAGRDRGQRACWRYPRVLWRRVRNCFTIATTSGDEKGKDGGAKPDGSGRERSHVRSGGGSRGNPGKPCAEPGRG